MSSNNSPIVLKKKLKLRIIADETIEKPKDLEVERENEEEDFEDCVFEDPPPPPSVATMVAFKTNRVKSCCGSADKNEVRSWCRNKYGKTWFKRGDKKTIMFEARNAICKTIITK